MKILKILLLVLLAVTTALYGVTTILHKSSGKDIGPSIQSSLDLLEVSAAHTQDDLLAGLSASDEQDGDLTDRIIVAGVSKLISQDIAKVTYLVFDSDDNMASYTRRIRYTDYHRPTLEVTEPLIFPSQSAVALVENLRATDVVDGDISESIRISTLSSTDDSNVFAVVAQVTNSMGDTSRVRLPVIIAESDPNHPVITLSRQLVYLDAGSSFDPDEYFVSATQSGSRVSADAVTVEHQVDTGTPGTYWVYYRCSAGGASGLAILTVIIP